MIYVSVAIWLKTCSQYFLPVSYQLQSRGSKEVKEP